MCVGNGVQDDDIHDDVLGSLRQTCVCLSVHLSARISEELLIHTSSNFLCMLPAVAAPSFLVALRHFRYCDTSGFVDVFMFAYNRPGNGGASGSSVQVTHKGQHRTGSRV